MQFSLYQDPTGSAPYEQFSLYQALTGNALYEQFSLYQALTGNALYEQFSPSLLQRNNVLFLLLSLAQKEVNSAFCESAVWAKYAAFLFSSLEAAGTFVLFSLFCS